MTFTDDRITCTQCQWLTANKYCNEYRYNPIVNLLRRCAGFKPYTSAADQRPGFKRWPQLTKEEPDAPKPTPGGKPR